MAESQTTRLECLCALGAAIGRYCPEHGDLARGEPYERSAVLTALECPWSDDLPERLRGYGYRMADQDGGTGEEWVTPQRDLEETLIEAIRQEFSAAEI